jgi:hypothetical protein
MDKLKISVLCASRGNPEGLRTIIGALDMLRSDRSDVQYVVACDLDDKATIEVASFMQPQILRVFSDSHSKSLGELWNRCAEISPADVYVLVTDRALCITPGWDNYIIDAYNKDDTRITWWTTNAGPVIPIVPEKWRQAAGQIYTDYFPFWFDDTWLQEVSSLVHGMPNFCIQAACFIQKRNPLTKRMRDLRFWMDFFIAKRFERIAHAAKIREVLGLKEPDMNPVFEWFAATEKLWDKDWKKWQEIMGDKSEPDQTYIEAKKNAEDMLI